LAPSFDVAVIGLGVMGSAIADALARRGRRVLGLDRFDPPHARGSSHGRSRVIREAYFEHPLYVPLVRRAYELWHELEREMGARLFTPTGLLSLGPPEGTVVAGARRSAREHHIQHEEVRAEEIRRRWPALRPPPGATAIHETRAGLLAVEACLETLLHRAAARGATLRTREAVLGWSATSDAVEVRTATGTHSAGALVISAGAWAASLLPGLALPLRVERRVVHWFAPARNGGALRGGHCPIVLWEHVPEKMFYTTPDTGHGVKAALHNDGEATAPDEVRPPSAEDEAASRALLARLLPDASGELLEARTCLYTSTPDGHFLVDRHPQHAQVLVASPCSGHGFKFAPAIGECVSDMLEGGREGPAPFAMARFAP
jgi:sarcosine oxidase